MKNFVFCAVQQVTEQHIIHGEQDKGRHEENAELLINCNNIDTILKARHFFSIFISLAF